MGHRAGGSMETAGIVRPDSSSEGREQRREAGWRRAAFRWIDAHSGQRLKLSIHGPSDLLARLEDQGFQRLDEDARDPAEGVAEGRAELEL